ncbi:F-box/kelch-repeat protein [Rosa sericea]
MSKEEEEVVFDLPEDVLVKILCRLPVKSLIRFTCVSKRWRSVIISDSQFARSTFQLASQTRTLRPRLLLCTYPYVRDHRFRFEWQPSRFECLGDLDMPCFGGNSLVHRPGFVWEPSRLTVPPEVKSGRVMASCNGLVVLGERMYNGDMNLTYTSYTNLCVWNPSTGFFCKIPSPEYSMKEGLGIFSVSWGFGHVMATDDYKFVFFVPIDFTVHIFSTRDSSWKVIRGPNKSFPRYDGKAHVVSNGAIHWVRTGIGKPAIYAFDLANEEFRQLPLPRAWIQNENVMNGMRIGTQVLSGGCLCIWSESIGYGVFWEMKEYAVPESWVKIFQFSVLDLPDVLASRYGWIPVFVTEGGPVVILIDDELVRIERHREEKPVCSGRYKIEGAKERLFQYSVTVFDETLLSV